MLVLVAHLPVLVIPPLHDVPDVEQSYTVPIPALDLVYLHFFIHSLHFHYIIRKFVYFLYIVEMFYLVNGQLTSQVTAEAEQLATACLLVLGYDY